MSEGEQSERREAPVDRPEESLDASAEAAAEGAPPGDAETARPTRRALRGVLLLAGLAVSAFLTGMFLFNNLIMPRLIHGTSEVRVPHLENLTVEQAQKSLQDAGLTLSQSGERFDPSVPRGFILSQDPPADTPVRGGRRVLVVVSLGEEFSSVPSLFGESLRSARLLLQRSGLRIGGITRAPSEEVGDGLIAGTDPPAETVLGRNGVVSMLVSTGAGEELYVMPELMGREITSIRRYLESLGFRVQTPPAAPSIGGIVYQDPPAGSRITLNTTITLQAAGRMIR